MSSLQVSEKQSPILSLTDKNEEQLETQLMPLCWMANEIKTGFRNQNSKFSELSNEKQFLANIHQTIHVLRILKRVNKSFDRTLSEF